MVELRGRSVQGNRYCRLIAEVRLGQSRHRSCASRKIIDVDSFESTFTEACVAMARMGSRTLYADTLHISLKGPDCKPLTVIDLPGLIHAASQKVTEADSKLSTELARKYLKEERTIVLAVISASNDVVNQAITTMTRQVDKIGARTMRRRRMNSMHSESQSAC